MRVSVLFQISCTGLRICGVVCGFTCMLRCCSVMFYGVSVVLFRGCGVVALGLLFLPRGVHVSVHVPSMTYKRPVRLFDDRRRVKWCRPLGYEFNRSSRIAPHGMSITTMHRVSLVSLGWSILSISTDVRLSWQLTLPKRKDGHSFPLTCPHFNLNPPKAE